MHLCVCVCVCVCVKESLGCTCTLTHFPLNYTQTIYALEHYITTFLSQVPWYQAGHYPTHSSMAHLYGLISYRSSNLNKEMLILIPTNLQNNTWAWMVSVCVRSFYTHTHTHTHLHVHLQLQRGLGLTSTLASLWPNILRPYTVNTECINQKP